MQGRAGVKFWSGPARPKSTRKTPARPGPGPALSQAQDTVGPAHMSGLHGAILEQFAPTGTLKILKNKNLRGQLDLGRVHYRSYTPCSANLQRVRLRWCYFRHCQRCCRPGRETDHDYDNQCHSQVMSDVQHSGTLYILI